MRCICTMLLVTLHFSLAAADETVSESQSCKYERAEMLALDQNTFDQSPAGWRSITRHGDCNIEAADLVRDYVAAHELNVSILYWHEGQLRAMAGQIDRAIPLLDRSRKLETTSDRFGWNHYVDATIAFLKKDKVKLINARAALSVTPKPSNYNPVDVNGNPVEMIWPPNLNVVDGLLDCFGQSYDQAYNNCSYPFSKRQVGATASEEIECSKKLAPIVRVAPEYPSSPPEGEFNGWVVVEFIVSEDGSTKSAIATESSSSRFERSAVLAALRLKYAKQQVPCTHQIKFQYVVE